MKWEMPFASFGMWCRRWLLPPARSALISLSDLGSDAMRGAKAGPWWDEHPHRALANNSAVYEQDRPPMGVFMAEWQVRGGGAGTWRMVV